MKFCHPRFVIQVVMIFASFVCWGQAVRADETTLFKFEDTISAAMRELAQLYLNEMIAGRERLVSGEYTAVGRVSGKHKEAPPLDGEISLSSTFDFQSDQLRFDRREPRYYRTDLVEQTDPLNAAEKKTTWTVKSGIMESRCVLIPERRITWQDGSGGEVHINAREDNWHGGTAAPFDIRTLGLSIRSGMDSGVPLAKLMTIFSKHSISDVTPESESVLRITMSYGPTKQARRHLWIDQSVGYSPIRMELWSNGDGGIPNTPAIRNTRATITWRMQERTWVPATYTIDGEVDQLETRKYELAFHWTKVNQPVDPDRFTPEGLKIQYYARVIDMRGDVPVMVAELNGPSPLAPPVVMPQAKKSSNQFLMINLGVAVIIIGLVILWRIKHVHSADA